jgi:hypothetical protein
MGDNMMGRDNLNFKIMKKIIFAIFLVLAFTVPGWATNYYINSVTGNDSYDGLAAVYNGTHGPWKTMNKVASSIFGPGDVIDGAGQIYYERLVFPSSGSADSGYITLQNFTLDGTFQINDGWTMLPYRTNGYPWSVSSGEVYKKYLTYIPYFLFEDGILLTAVGTTSVDQANAISRGQYAWYGNYVYYRASDGAAPLSHNIQVTRRDWDNLSPILYFPSKSYITLKNIIVKCNRTKSDTGITLENCNHFLMDNVDSSYCGRGLNINTSTNIKATNLNIHHNVNGGVGMQGNMDNISLQGKFSNNGRVLYFVGTSATYNVDGDNIGIGGSGGTVGTITIHDSIIENSGAPDGNPNAYGSGIYIGGANIMAIDKIICNNNIFRGNHYSAFISYQYAKSVDFNNNIIYKNRGYQNYQTVSINCTNNAFTNANICNNVWYGNTGRAALYLNHEIVTDGYVNFKNNIFMDNGVSGVSYFSDIWFSSQNKFTKVQNGYNLFWRSAGTWGTALLIEIANKFYNLPYIVGNSAGYFSYDKNSPGNIVADPKFVDAANGDFRLQQNSPAINAGTNVGLIKDFQGNLWGDPPSIGAIEYYNIAGVVSPKTISGKSGKLSK